MKQTGWGETQALEAGLELMEIKMERAVEIYQMIGRNQEALSAIPTQQELEKSMQRWKDKIGLATTADEVEEYRQELILTIGK